MLPLTLAEPCGGYWVVGFDTGHLFCRPDVYDRKLVLVLTESLFCQFFDTKPVELEPPKEWWGRYLS